MNSVLAMTASAVPAENQVLGALPEADYRRLRPNLELVALPVGRVLSEPSEPVTDVFFPTSGIVSVLTLLENGASTGVALTGNEGLVGVSVFLEGLGAASLRRAVVLSAGHAYRARADCLFDEFERGAALQHLVLRATQALIAQIGQTVACNRRHDVLERLSSWLLHSLDRLPGNKVCVTQRTLSDLLGIRREGVTEAAGQLQSEGAIQLGRGHVLVRDRLALEQRACECYAMVSRESARLSPASARRDMSRAPATPRFGRVPAKAVGAGLARAPCAVRA